MDTVRRASAPSLSYSAIEIPCVSHVLLRLSVVVGVPTVQRLAVVPHDTDLAKCGSSGRALVLVSRVNIGPFTFGWHTFWLDLHGLLMFLILVFAAFLFGAIFFSKEPDARTVRRLKISAAGTFVALLALMITGFIPDTGFTSGSAVSGTIHNSYGTFASQVTDDGLGNFTGPLLFDIMEHVSLIVPGLAAVAGVLIFHYSERVITVPVIRRSVLSIMALTGIWTLVIGALGVYITKLLTFPVGS